MRIPFLTIPLLGVLSLPAFGQVSVHTLSFPALCGKTETLHSLALTHHKQQPRVIGIGKEGKGAFSVLTSENDETFTFLISTAEGNSCVIFTGGAIQIISPEPIGPKS